MARASGENFRVASKLLPPAARRHLLAFYGYARLVDEIGDAYAGDRTAALDWTEGELRRALTGGGTHELVRRAAVATIELQADPRPLFDLIEANRQDQLVGAYATFDDLLGYCQVSANPVGRLVLAAFQVDSPARRAWSDSVCTGLQLAEHWQDVTEDARAGRVYLPESDLERFGVRPGELTATGPASRALRALMAFEAARARRYLDDGSPLVASLRGRSRWAVAGFVAGGQAALDAMAARGFDPLGGAPRPRAVRVARRLGAVLRGPRSPGEVAG
jgi:squalene synthase HpnC